MIKLLAISEWFGNLFKNHGQQRSRKKKFIVVSESSLRRRNNSCSGKFGNISQTRPQKCPLCRTEEARQPGNIFRTPEDKWGCKACGHQW
jgi:hypothetical protein